MTFTALAAIAVSCAVISPPWNECMYSSLRDPIQHVAGITSSPQFTGQSLDVVLTGAAALAWDNDSGAVLYAKNPDIRRPVASLQKLASVLVVQEMLAPDQIVQIPAAVASVQRAGADITLPIGHHTTVSDLQAASLIASANDAILTLAIAAAGTEEKFVSAVNTRLPTYGINNTKLSNSTGLTREDQYSSASDIRAILAHLVRVPAIRTYLAQKTGILITREGARRVYRSTNKLLDTYLPVVAAKTGYTREAGENLVLITKTSGGHHIGAVILGSTERFQDMKILVEWIERNYTWPE